MRSSGFIFDGTIHEQVDFEIVTENLIEKLGHFATDQCTQHGFLEGFKVKILFPTQEKSSINNV